MKDNNELVRGDSGFMISPKLFKTNLKAYNQVPGDEYLAYYCYGEK